MKKKIFGLCCALGIGTTTLFAQQAVVGAGGNATGTGGSVSYSIGQVFYVSAKNTSNNIVQGVQQPYEISTVTGVEETAARIELNANVYPVPATDVFTLKVSDHVLKDMHYVMYDAFGKLILKGEIGTEETVIPISDLAASHYFLSVLESDKILKTFKITKAY